MNPGNVKIEAIRDAFQSMRPVTPALEEHWVACILDHGVQGLPQSKRAEALRAIGSDPELAAMIAELDDPEHRIEGHQRGFRVTAAWRVAFAACTALATGTSFWMMTHGGSSAQPPQVLDGSAPVPQALSTGLRGSELLILVGVWLAAMATFMPAVVWPRMAARARARAQETHAGE